MAITKNNTRMLEGEDLTLTGDLTVSGNVGIGTASPNSYAGQTALTINSTAVARLDLDISDTLEGHLISESGYVGLFAKSGGSVRFGNASERMRIDSSGTVLLSGMTAPTSSEQLALSVNSAVNFGIGIKGTSASNNAVYARFYNASGATAGEIAQNGSTSTNFTTSSDYRLKENVVDITDGITRVKQLEPKKFNFIADADTTVDGFLAHEAQEVVPESVTGTKDEVDEEGNPVMQGIDQAKLVPLLTAALQEAIAKIEVLETKVAALEA